VAIVKDEVSAFRVNEIPELLVLGNVFAKNMEADINILLNKFENALIACTV
jgi:hypothetical protein